MESMLKLIKHALIVFFALTILFSIILFFIVRDARDISANFQTNTKLFILMQNGNVIVGAGVKDFAGTDFQPLKLSELLVLKNKLDNRLYGEISASYWRTFLINIDYLALNLADSYSVFELGMNFSKAEVLAILMDERGSAQIQEKLDAVEYILSSTGQPEPMQTFKSTLFMYVLSRTMNEQGSLFIVQGIKNGGVVVIPNSALFKAMKFVPMALIRDQF